MASSRDATPPHVQAVTAVNGFAYGAIGADIHVFSNGLPLYLLANWVAGSAADADWLRELPSRMLNPHHGVVPFTGRDAELADLRQWRDSRRRLAVRWLHGPGGQGKTRLATQFAAECADGGWKVIVAFHGPDADRLSSGSQDMSLNGEVGLLVLVDYADRWLTTNLTWFFKNSLLHRADVPVRVLMLARTAGTWPAIRAILNTYQASTSSQFLSPLPEDSAERGEMFDAARNGFGTVYRRPGSADAERPESLANPEFGLTLAVHMLALVIVDSAATGRAAPADADELTVYLLDRELLHWARLYGDGAAPVSQEGRAYRTPPEVMNQAVFAAALTGTVSTAIGSRILAELEVPDPGRTLLDHAICYPSSGPGHGDVFEPIYPDRLAEDFIALTLPGHHADYPAQDWAPGALAVLLARGDSQQAAPAWAPRAMTFLASAASRWPHLRRAYVQPLLLDDPQLALDAGSVALAAISELPEIEPMVLAAIEARLPEQPVLDLDVGVAALARRLAGHRLAELDDPGERAAILHDLGVRLSAAGAHDEALAAFEEAAEIQRPLAGTDSSAFEPTLAGSLSLLGGELWELGRLKESLAAADEAVTAYRRLAAADPERHRATFAMALNNQAIAFAATGRPGKAVAAAREAVALYRDAAETDQDAYLPDLATALTTLSGALGGAGRQRKALAAAQEAVAIRRRLADANPGVYEAGLATSLSNLGAGLSATGRLADGLAAAREAVELWRRLARANVAHESSFAASAENLAMDLWAMGQREDSAAANQEAVGAYRRLVRINGSAYVAALAASLFNLGGRLLELGRPDQALSPATEAATMLRRLADDDQAAHGRDFAQSLDNLASILRRLGRTREVAATETEGAAAYRRLASTDPASKPELAHTLSNLGADLSYLEKWQDAHAVTQEAVALYRELAKADRAGYTPGLARALFNLGRMLAGLDQPEEAVSASREAVALYRLLARRDPEAYELRLAGSLTNLAIELGRLGASEQALNCAREAAGIRARAGTRGEPQESGA